MTLAFFDLETRVDPDPGVIPRPVAMGKALDGAAVSIVPYHDPRAWLAACREVLGEGAFPVAYNGAAFDLAVLWAHGPWSVQELVWKALGEGRVIDPMITDRLVHHATGRPSRWWRGIADAAAETLKVHVQKEDTWRLRYQELEGIAPEAWPEEARAYLEKDVEVLRALHLAHAEKGWIGAHGEAGRYVRTMAEDTRAAFAIRLMAVHGLPVDPLHVETVWLPEYQRQLAEAHKAGMVGGYLSPSGTMAQKKIQEQTVAWVFPEESRRAPYLARVEALKAKIKASGLKAEDRAFDEDRAPIQEMMPHGVSITDTGGISVTGPSCIALRKLLKTDADRALLTSVAAAVEHKRIKSQITGDGVKKGKLAEFRAGGRYTYRSRYDTILATGRTSSSGLHGKTSPTALGGSSQTMAGEYDLPAHYRQRCCIRAPAGFVFIDSDYAQLELYTLAQCCLKLVGWSRLADALRAGQDPHLITGAALRGLPMDAFLRLSKDEIKHWRTLAKPFNFGIPGGMGKVRFCAHALEAYGVEIPLEDFWRLKNAYLDTYPEVRIYMEIMGSQKTITYPTVGYTRGGVGFCDACNGPFQGTGAYGMKSAVWSWVMSCFHKEGTGRKLGMIPLAEVHDQFLSMCPEENAAAAAELQTRIMVQAGSRYTPDLQLKVETTICYTWNKGLPPDPSGGVALMPGEQPRRRDPALHGPWALLAREQKTG